MGGNPEEICNGECAVFATRLVDRLGEGVIVNGLSNEMADEIDGYESRKPVRRIRTSHCWVDVDGILFDAYNPEGVENEEDLEFYQIWG